MRLRLAETPWGLARFTYAYLAALLAGLIAGIVALIGYPVLTATPVCQGDPTGWCLPIAVVGVGWLGLVAGSAAMAFAFRLGWAWAAWSIVLVLVVAQIVIESNSFAVAGLLFLVPALAAAITYERPDRDPPVWLVGGRRILLVLLALQFVVWLAVLLVHG